MQRYTVLRPIQLLLEFADSEVVLLASPRCQTEDKFDDSYMKNFSLAIPIISK